MLLVDFPFPSLSLVILLTATNISCCLSVTTLLTRIQPTSSAQTATLVFGRLCLLRLDASAASSRLYGYQVNMSKRASDIEE